MKFRGEHFKKGNKHSGSPKDWSGKKHKGHGSGSNVFTSPGAAVFTSGSSSEWVLTVKPELDIEVRKENLEIVFKDPANPPVVAGVALVEHTFNEPELDEDTWVQEKLDAATAIETGRHNQCVVAIQAQYPVGKNRNKALYEETLKQLENESKMRSDFQREFQTLNDNRMKRKDKYDENLAKCLKTITAKIGPALLMRVNDLILVNRWR